MRATLKLAFLYNDNNIIRMHDTEMLDIQPLDNESLLVELGNPRYIVGSAEKHEILRPVT
jgi:hypothetical protein